MVWYAKTPSPDPDRFILFLIFVAVPTLAVIVPAYVLSMTTDVPAEITAPVVFSHLTVPSPLPLNEPSAVTSSSLMKKCVPASTSVNKTNDKLSGLSAFNPVKAISPVLSRGPGTKTFDN